MHFFSFRLVALFIFCFFAAGFRPDLKPLLSCTIQTGAGHLLTDNLGNAYMIQAETIAKFLPNCSFFRAYSNKTFGAITSADATNPLRIVLFYRDFNRVVFLDDMMSQNGDPVELETFGFPTATLVCSSRDNGLWIFERQNNELIRLNRNMQIEQRTGNLAQIIDTTLQPNFLIEKDTKLFLNNPVSGVLVFDLFGTYSKTIPVKGIRALQVIDDNVVYYNNHRLLMWDMLTNEESLLQTGDTIALDMRIEKEKLFMMRKDEVRTYTY
ncbi:MAG TPA: hypothetical protein VI731_03035 [Bacteroidia bacterium]|nr:hypothetical protein [Bacteroidia bacterium]